MMNMLPDLKSLDVGWIKLIEEARDMGLSVEEVKEFIEKVKN
ncbi:anti-repressor SinI family protein [Halobacillus seohaensis]|uniref:Anti-repressor SinI family protein n=1 Tax=Halobacillus seohaensis TaxID=447421 RepID=A0ABW2EP00_9BACI